MPPTLLNKRQLENTGYVCQGRLTLESGVPVSASDQASKGTIYFTPYMGDIIYLYNSTNSRWQPYTFSELSLSCSSSWYASKVYTNDPAAGYGIVLNISDTSCFAVGDPIVVVSTAGTDFTYITAIVTNTSITAFYLPTNHTVGVNYVTVGKNVDIWAYDNSGVVALDSTLWTNSTTRSVGLSLTNGVYHKTGDLTRRYIGTIRTRDTAGPSQIVVDDTFVRRNVWNMYNREKRRGFLQYVASHTYGTNAWQPFNNVLNSNNVVEFVTGLQQSVPFSFDGFFNGYYGYYGGYIDFSTSAVGANFQIFNGITSAQNWIAEGTSRISNVAPGFHNASIWEMVNPANTVTFYNISMSLDILG